MVTTLLFGLLAFISIGCFNGASLVTDDGSSLKLAWLEYDSSRNAFPQCCDQGMTTCTMVRVSDETIDNVKNSNLLRVRLNNPLNNMEMVLSYDANLGGVTGKVYTETGVYFVEPTSLKQRDSEPCFKERQTGKMALFHKLVRQSGPVDAPALLLQKTKSPPTVFEECCPDGSTSCEVVKVDVSSLKKVNSPPFQLPLSSLPAKDGSETFTIGFKKPTGCSRDCDIYLFTSQSGGELKVNQKEEGHISASLTTHGGQMYSLDYCLEEYVWIQTPITQTHASSPQQTLQDQDQDETMNDLYDINTDPDDYVFSDSGPQPGDAAFYDYVEELQPTEKQITLVRAAPGPACWYTTYYCDQSHGKIHTVNAEGANKDAEQKFCYEKCVSTVSCTHFTYFKSRDHAQCHLLNTCVKVEGDVCQSSGSCLSGPANCTVRPDNKNCTAPVQLDQQYIRWQCETKKGDNIYYNNKTTLYPGTLCLLTCSSWKTAEGGAGYLESECQEDGLWSPTRSFNGQKELAYPDGPYPRPDVRSNITITGTQSSSTLADVTMGPITCDCPPLPIVWPPGSKSSTSTYDPNDEEEASDFLCDSPLSDSLILSGNECRLFCDSYLFVTVKCFAGAWTGQPEKGFWCYNKPNETALGLCTYTEPEPISWSNCSSDGIRTKVVSLVSQNGTGKCPPTRLMSDKCGGNEGPNDDSITDADIDDEDVTEDDFNYLETEDADSEYWSVGDEFIPLSDDADFEEYFNDTEEMEDFDKEVADVKVGDVTVLSDEQYQEAIGNTQSRGAMRNGRYKWPRRHIPYSFRYPNIGKHLRHRMKKAMKEMNHLFGRCTTFRPYKKKDGHKNLRIRKAYYNEGCSATQGYRRKHSYIHLNGQCSSKGMMQHLLMHTLGIYNEHRRGDRDKYVRIHFKNMQQKYRKYFQKYNRKKSTTYGMAYNFKSITHYASRAFSKNGKQTIKVKNPSLFKTGNLGQRRGLSLGDIQLVQRHYGCAVGIKYTGRTGRWAPKIQFCGKRMYVIGYQLRSQRDQKGRDDTAVNDIRLYCRKKNGGKIGVIRSKHPKKWFKPIGHWTHKTYCKNKRNPVIGFDVRVEGHYYNKRDKTGINGLDLYCKNGWYIHATVPIKWGKWIRPKKCRKGEAVRGFRTRTDKTQIRRYDNSALNGVEMFCQRYR